MQIRVHFHGSIDRRGLEQDAALALDAPATVGAALSKLGYPNSHRRFIIAMVGGEKRPESHELHDGAQLELLVPLGGG